MDSFAWARMTTSGDVDAESVFWPPIDAAIVREATAFRTLVSDASAHKAFVAGLPEGVEQDIGVVIHHSNAAAGQPPVALASYDVKFAGRSDSAIRHFDRGGVELTLPR
jgi:hypothetical protein